jgi:hypothetical protein
MFIFLLFEQLVVKFNKDVFQLAVSRNRDVTELAGGASVHT